MKKKNQYKLGEAVKELYQIEPLQHDLATTVADKVFDARTKDSSALDKILGIALCAILAASFIYVYGFLTELSAVIILLFLAAVGGLTGLSIKEHFILVKQINDK